MKVLSSATLMSVVLAFFACTPSSEEPQSFVEQAAATENDQEAVRQAAQALVAATVAGDAETYAAFFTDDAIMMVPNTPSVVGKDEIRASLEATLELYKVEWGNSIEEVIVAGEWAFERSSYRWTLSPKSEGDPVDEVGKILAIWQRGADGSWRRTRVIWNSDNPPNAQ